MTPLAASSVAAPPAAVAVLSLVAMSAITLRHVPPAKNVSRLSSAET
jgi:hypothetical protein